MSPIGRITEIARETENARRRNARPDVRVQGAVVSTARMPLWRLSRFSPHLQ